MDQSWTTSVVWRGMIFFVPLSWNRIVSFSPSPDPSL